MAGGQNAEPSVRPICREQIGATEGSPKGWGHGWPQQSGIPAVNQLPASDRPAQAGLCVYGWGTECRSSGCAARPCAASRGFGPGPCCARPRSFPTILSTNLPGANWRDRRAGAKYRDVAGTSSPGANLNVIGCADDGPEVACDRRVRPRDGPNNPESRRSTMPRRSSGPRKRAFVYSAGR